MAKVSKFRPDMPNPPGTGVAMFSSPGEAIDELVRRMMVLGQVEYLYEGLAIRMASSSAVRLYDLASTDEKYSSHEGYVSQIDVFEVPEGFHVSVDAMSEIPVLRAELGSQTTRLQPLWRPMSRSEQRKADRLGRSLAKKVADKASKGIALVDADLNSLIPEPDPGRRTGLNILREIVQSRKSRMAREE